MTYSRPLEPVDPTSGSGDNHASIATRLPRGRRPLIIGGAAILIAIALVVGAQFLLGQRNAAPPPRPVPVILGTAKTEDVPIYASGLGTVQAWNTVTVKVRVDGEIQKIGFVEGQDVRQGDLLAQIDPRPFQAQLGLAEANRARDEAQLANAKRDLDRSLALVGQGFATRQSVDTLRANVAQLEAAVRGDGAQIDAAKLQITYSTITAPISGRTGVRLLDQGNIVRATDNTGLVVITQIEPVSVVFTLPQEALDAVSRAAAAHPPLTVLAYGRDDATTPRAQGTLLLLNNQIDPATGTIQLKATFPNTDHRLWPGQFVNVNLLLETLHNAVTVPATVVQTGPSGPFAYIVGADGTASVRAVQLGQVRNNVAVIQAGLSAGDAVVVDGQYKLRPGAHVVDAQKASPDPAPKAAP